MSLTTISRDLSAAVSNLRFSDPVAYIYNPLDYAREPHETYLARFGTCLLYTSPSPRDS